LEGDQPLNQPIHETIVYELHVGGFTRSSTAGVRHPGTFGGIVEKIPYLKSLGITAVELLPVSVVRRLRPVAEPLGRAIRNSGAYSTVGFGSPHAGYAVDQTGQSRVDEFRDMVKALHRAGIE
jgi:glycogen operon protein